MPPSAGSILKENLVLGRELGRGAMGVVWLAHNRTLDSRVAVKVLSARGLGSDEARARFAREARAVARIDSPHVVRVFDYGTTDDGDPFFVMELLRGRDLKSHLEEHGPLEPDDAVTVVRQLCAALGRAHELSVVHRDIKPANVFLSEGSEDLFVKVVDFGIARLVTDGGLDLTATTALLGTPYYMSPEQFVDPRGIDARADLWSVAVVAYACLTGCLPFQGDTVGALSLTVHRGEFTPATEHRSSLPPAVDAWFRRALDPEPSKRFQTARELADAFTAALRGERPRSGGLASEPSIEPPPPRAASERRSVPEADDSEAVPSTSAPGGSLTRSAAPRRAARRRRFGWIAAVSTAWGAGRALRVWRGGPRGARPDASAAVAAPALDGVDAAPAPCAAPTPPAAASAPPTPSAAASVPDVVPSVPPERTDGVGLPPTAAQRPLPPRPPAPRTATATVPPPGPPATPPPTRDAWE